MRISFRYPNHQNGVSFLVIEFFKSILLPKKDENILTISQFLSNRNKQFSETVTCRNFINA